VHIYFGTKNKKSFLRLQDKIRLHSRSLLKCLQVLDNRLDVFVVRLGWGRTIRIARSMILFGVLVVNDVIVKKMYHLITEGDSISLNLYAFKVFTMFKCLRKKSVVRYKMYRDLIKKKKFRLQGR
jgi:ribosomal protein S4